MIYLMNSLIKEHLCISAFFHKILVVTNMEIEYSEINKNIKIIDIRHPLDYEEFHVSNSINIPRLKLLGDPEKYISKNKKVYLLCDKGIVSKSSAKILNELGYNCVSVKGGIESI